MSTISKTLSEQAKKEGKFIHIHEYEYSHIYHSYNTHNHLCNVIDIIINRISNYTPLPDESNDEIFINMSWNETYDTVRVHMTLDTPFWSIFVHYGKLDYMVCDIFNKKLNDIGFQLQTVPEIYEGTDGVGGPDSMIFTLKMLP